MSDFRDSLRALYAFDDSKAYQEHVQNVEREFDRLMTQVTALSHEKPYEALSLGLIEAIATLRVSQQAADLREAQNRELARQYVETLKADAEARKAEALLHGEEVSRRQQNIETTAEAFRILLNSKWAWLVLLIISVLLIGGTAGLDSLVNLFPLR